MIITTLSTNPTTLILSSLVSDFDKESISDFLEVGGYGGAAAKGSTGKKVSTTFSNKQKE